MSRGADLVAGRGVHPAADGNPPGADEAAEEAPCDDAAVFVSAYFPPGCGNRLDAARENDPQADRSVHDRDAKLG